MSARSPVRVRTLTIDGGEPGARQDHIFIPGACKPKEKAGQ